MIFGATQMPRNPAPEFPVRTYPSPVISEQVVIEWITSEFASSHPLDPGSPHPNSRDFPNHKLGIQRVDPRDPYFTQRLWVNDQAPNLEAYNYAIKYVAESNSYPIFVRSDRELKTSYSPRTKGSALQSVYKLTVSNAGSGYTYGTQPALTFSSGTAAGHGIVAPDGTIAEFILTNGGLGYVSAPTFTVAAPPSGTTATGTAYIQPTSAILIKEDASQFDETSEFFALYFQVTRVYYTLPGPILTSKQMSDAAQGTVTTITKQELVASAADYTPNFKTLEYKDVAIDSVRKERTLELFPSNQDFPALFDYDIDEETEQTILTRYDIVDASTATTATISSGVVTKFKHIDRWRSMRIVTTYSTPANYNEQRLGAYNFPTLFNYQSYTWSSECGAFIDETTYAGGLRASFSTMVRMKTVVSFSTTEPSDINGLTLIPKTLILGKGVQLPNDLIVDAGSFTYIGTCSGTVAFGGSTPDYTTYLGTILGTEQLITGEWVKVKGGLWRITSVFVFMI